MGRGGYIGGHTVITAGGHGWSYDPCEVSNPVVKKASNPVVEKVSNPVAKIKRLGNREDSKDNTEIQKPPSKTKKQEAAEKVRLKEFHLRQFAGRCALSDKHGNLRPQRPPEVKMSWLAREKQKNRFEKMVQEVLSRLE